MFANAFFFLVWALLGLWLLPSPKQIGVKWYHYIIVTFLFLGVCFLIAGIYIFLSRYAI